MVGKKSTLIFIFVLLEFVFLDKYKNSTRNEKIKQKKGTKTV
jgi:hypothetical protein